MPKKHHRILIVEDDPAVRWMLAVLFQRHGVETDVAESGREAVRLLERQVRYCAVLLDLRIPPPDGIEIAKHVRDHDSNTPVVVISGVPDLVSKIGNADLGSVVRLIVMKPIDSAFLVRYVHGDQFCIRDTPPNAPPNAPRATDVALDVKSEQEQRPADR